jgi:hypothetical protein
MFMTAFPERPEAVAFWATFVGVSTEYCKVEKGGEYLTELHSPEHTRVRAGTIGTQDLHSQKLHLLGDTEGLATNCARDVAAVALLISVLDKM